MTAFAPPQGSTITYGSTITLQAFHGGILCFNSKVPSVLYCYFSGLCRSPRASTSNSSPVACHMKANTSIRGGSGLLGIGQKEAYFGVSQVPDVLEQIFSGTFSTRTDLLQFLCRSREDRPCCNCDTFHQNNSPSGCKLLDGKTSTWIFLSTPDRVSPPPNPRAHDTHTHTNNQTHTRTHTP